MTEKIVRNDTTKEGTSMFKTRITRTYGGEKSVNAYPTAMQAPIAVVAERIIDRWALVAAMPDGEDSAGRQKLRLPTTSELVTRAFDIAEAYYAAARERGHLIDLPDLNEVNAEYDAKQAEESARDAEHRAAKRV